jgi:hypothetical protein
MNQRWSILDGQTKGNVDATDRLALADPEMQTLEAEYA